jgi:tetratricopeptide (TPR) repeat protein
MNEIGTIHEKCRVKGIFKSFDPIAHRITDAVGRVEDLASRCTFKDRTLPLKMLSQASNFMNALALSQLEDKKFVETVASGRSSARLAELAHDQEGVGYALSCVGDALDECGDYEGAIEAYGSSAAIAEEQRTWNELTTRHHKVAVTHEARGQVDAARAAYLRMSEAAKAQGATEFDLQMLHKVMEDRLRKATADIAAGRLVPKPSGQGAGASFNFGGL